MKAIKLFSAILLLLAISNMPSGYYFILRVIITVSASLALILEYKRLGVIWIVTFISIIATFNPIFPIYLHNKIIWGFIDIFVAILFIVSAFFPDIFSKNKNKQIAPDSEGFSETEDFIVNEDEKTEDVFPIAEKTQAIDEDLQMIFFIGIRTTAGGLTIDLIFYYQRIGNLVRILLDSRWNDMDFNRKTIFQVGDQFEVDKDFLLDNIGKWMINNELMYGLEYNFYSSPIMSKQEFDGFLADLTGEVKVEQLLQTEKFKGNDIIEYVSDIGYKLTLSQENNNCFRMICPKGLTHFLSIDAEKGNWNCPVCKESGGFPEFIDFIHEAKNHEDNPISKIFETAISTAESIYNEKDEIGKKRADSYLLISNILNDVRSNNPKILLCANEATILEFSLSDCFVLKEISPVTPIADCLRIGNRHCLCYDFNDQSRQVLIVYWIDRSGVFDLPIYEIEDNGHPFIIIKGDIDNFQFKLYKFQGEKDLVLIKDYV